MNIYLNNVKENWIIDRVRRDWYKHKKIFPHTLYLVQKLFGYYLLGFGIKSQKNLKEKKSSLLSLSF